MKHSRRLETGFVTPLVLVAGLGCSGGHAPIANERFHDAGPIFQDATPLLVHRFPVRNTTNRTLSIVKKNCSCTCTQSELGKTTLAPGEQTTLEFQVRTNDVYREMAVHCSLITDEPTARDLTYKLHFRSYPRIHFPESIRLVLDKTGAPRGGGGRTHGWMFMGLRAARWTAWNRLTRRPRLLRLSTKSRWWTISKTVAFAGRVTA